MKLPLPGFIIEHVPTDLMTNSVQVILLTAEVLSMYHSHETNKAFIPTRKCFQTYCSDRFQARLLSVKTSFIFIMNVSAQRFANR